MEHAAADPYGCIARRSSARAMRVSSASALNPIHTSPSRMIAGPRTRTVRPRMRTRASLVFRVEFAERSRRLGHRLLSDRKQHAKLGFDPIYVQYQLPRIARLPGY
jgi:hypothetical protein